MIFSMGSFLTVVAFIYPLYFLSLWAVFFFLLAQSRKIIKAQFSKLSLLDGLIISGLMIIGAFLRVFGTAHIDLDPYGWGFVIDAMAIKGFSSLSSASHVPGFSSLISLPLIFSKDLALVSDYIIFFSVLTIGVVYLLTFLITEDRIAAVFATGLLVASKLSIQYSGQEIPIACSVFLVTGAFLFFILWLRTREVTLGMLATISFFISFNIKSENSIFLILVFLFVLFDRKKMLVIFLVLSLIISFVFWVPFIKNALPIQYLTWIYHQHGHNEPYGIRNLFDHCKVLIIDHYYMFPIWMAIGFALLRKNNIILCWFCMALLYFLWYSDFCAELNMLQVLIPVFIMSGSVVSKTLDLYTKQCALKYSVVIAFLMFSVIDVIYSVVHQQKAYSWVDLKNNLPRTSDEDCIISPDPDGRFTSFALSFIFPNRHWIFLRDKDAAKKFSQCSGKIYYFDPTPYGVEGTI